MRYYFITYQNKIQNQITVIVEDHQLHQKIEELNNNNKSDDCVCFQLGFVGSAPFNSGEIKFHRLAKYCYYPFGKLVASIDAQLDEARKNFPLNSIVVFVGNKSKTHYGEVVGYSQNGYLKLIDSDNQEIIWEIHHKKVAVNP